MFTWLNKRLSKDESGFTLIELMVVVLIIAILIAIAIPTFLGARRRAQDRQAQSNVRNALTAAKVYYTDAQAFSDTPGDYTDIETSVTFTSSPTGALAASREVGIDLSVASNTDAICVGSKSKSGTIFLLFDVASASTASDAGTYYLSGSAPTCPTVVPPGGSWNKSGW